MWQACRPLAEAHGLPQPIGLQYAYSLIDRGVELDVLPAGLVMGMGLVAWSSVAAGLLTGKYGREKLAQHGMTVSVPDRGSEAAAGGSDGRLNGNNPFGGVLFTEANFDAMDRLRVVAAELGRPMAQVALHWAAHRPGVSSVLIGASRVGQLRENIASLDLHVSPEQAAALDAVLSLPQLNPYFIFDLPRAVLFGGQAVAPWRPVS